MGNVCGTRENHPLFDTTKIGEFFYVGRTWIILGGFLLHRMKRMKRMGGRLLVSASVKFVQSDVNKKPCYPHGQQDLAKVKNLNENIQSKDIVSCVRLHIVVAYFVGRA